MGCGTGDVGGEAGGDSRRLLGVLFIVEEPPAAIAHHQRLAPPDLSENLHADPHVAGRADRLGGAHDGDPSPRPRDTVEGLEDFLGNGLRDLSPAGIEVRQPAVQARQLLLE